MRMSAASWAERAERLRGELSRLHFTHSDTSDKVTLERQTIARWLRNEFSNEPVEDTATMRLFQEETAVQSDLRQLA